MLSSLCIRTYSNVIAENNLMKCRNIFRYTLIIVKLSCKNGSKLYIEIRPRYTMLCTESSIEQLLVPWEMCSQIL